jgi:hypothetical protein
VSFISKFPIFPLFSSFFPFSNSKTLSFFVPSLLFFPFLLPSPNSIPFYFVLFQNMKTTSLHSVLPVRPELHTESDAVRQHSYLNLSRAETKKQAFQTPAISIGFHFLNINYRCTS